MGIDKSKKGKTKNRALIPNACNTYIEQIAMCEGLEIYATEQCFAVQNPPLGVRVPGVCLVGGKKSKWYAKEAKAILVPDRQK